MATWRAGDTASEYAAELRTADIIASLSFANGTRPSVRPDLRSIAYMRMAMGQVQHHDGVSGTEKQYVADDYAVQMSRGASMTREITTPAVARYLARTPADQPRLTTDVTVINSLPAGGVAAAVIYNSVAWTRRHFVRIILNRADIAAVTDEQGADTPFQVDAVPPYSLDRAKGSHVLYFLASLPPLGATTYFIRVSPSGQSANVATAQLLRPTDNIEISNSIYSVQVDSASGLIAQILNKRTGVSQRVQQQLFQYIPAAQDGEQASGAYVFRPAQENRTLVGSNNIPGDSRNPVKNFRHPFVLPLAYTPLIVATARGGAFKDTFTLTTRQVDSGSVVLNAARIDAVCATRPRPGARSDVADRACGRIHRAAGRRISSRTTWHSIQRPPLWAACWLAAQASVHHRSRAGPSCVSASRGASSGLHWCSRPCVRHRATTTCSA